MEVSRQDAALIIIKEAHHLKHHDYTIARLLHGNDWENHCEPPDSPYAYKDDVNVLFRILDEVSPHPLVEYLNRRFQDTRDESIPHPDPTLMENESLAVRLRFGWDDGRIKSFAEVGNEMGGISRTRARELVRKGLWRLAFIPRSKPQK